MDGAVLKGTVAAPRLRKFIRAEDGLWEPVSEDHLALNLDRDFPDTANRLNSDAPAPSFEVQISGRRPDDDDDYTMFEE